MYCRGIRGATTVEANTSEDILVSTRQLLALMIRRNDIQAEDVASATLTTTADVDAQFPALAVRQLGWSDVPLLCGNEMPVPGALPMCVRILVNWNTTKTQQEIQHVYLKEAVSLRPDIIHLPPVDWTELDGWIAEQMACAR